MKLKDVIDFVENNEICDVEAICIEAPEPAEISDEDSAEEDEGGLIDNISGHQLETTASIIMRKQSHEVEETGESNADEPKHKKFKKHFSWKNKDLHALNANFSDANYSSYRN